MRFREFYEAVSVVADPDDSLAVEIAAVRDSTSHEPSVVYRVRSKKFGKCFEGGSVREVTKAFENFMQNAYRVDSAVNQIDHSDES